MSDGFGKVERSLGGDGLLVHVTFGWTLAATHTECRSRGNKWLNLQSQRRSYNWKGFDQLLEH